VVVHVYNPSIQEAEAGALEFKASLGYIARLASFHCTPNLLQIKKI
jgi:hypothetical protein